MPGRSKAYESIIKGETIRKLNVPESFNVLVRELKGLCLDVNLLGGHNVFEQLPETQEKDQENIEQIEDKKNNNKKN